MIAQPKCITYLAVFFSSIKPLRIAIHQRHRFQDLCSIPSDCVAAQGGGATHWSPSDFRASKEMREIGIFNFGDFIIFMRIRGPLTNIERILRKWGLDLLHIKC
jgi:hypothetical protein